jgi:hypothetical protein
MHESRFGPRPAKYNYEHQESGSDSQTESRECISKGSALNK